MRLLLIEDDPALTEVLSYLLEDAGHELRITARGAEGIASVGWADCVILDVGLPDMDGFDVCREIRRSSEVPILFLTSRSDEIDRVVGLEIGADDYVLKPFSSRELLARIKAITRRISGGHVPEPSQQALKINREHHRVEYGCKKIDLSRMEFELLDALASAPGRVFTRDQLLDKVWPDGGVVTDRTVDAHIKSLRKKLGDADAIETVRGVGYRFPSP